MVLEKSGHYSTKEQVDELLTDNNPNFEKIDILLNSLLTYEASWLIQDKDNLSLITQLLEKLLDCDFQKWTIKDGVDIEKYKKFTDDIVDLCLNFDYDKKKSGSRIYKIY
ncbi:MAG: hypothetical protein HWD59_14770 [Coxiellaceae bacterium]|nr:MAG: hypothetical protein HWD59_14770 [Coxiellaceae bacterium]